MPPIIEVMCAASAHDGRATDTEPTSVPSALSGNQKSKRLRLSPVIGTEPKDAGSAPLALEPGFGISEIEPERSLTGQVTLAVRGPNAPS